MKFLLTSFLLLLLPAARLAAQDFPAPFKFEREDSVRLGKDELYARVLAWVDTTYKSPKDLFQLERMDGYRIMGKARIEAQGYSLLGDPQGIVYIDYSYTIDIRDSFYHAELYDFGQYHTKDYKGTPGGSLDHKDPEGGYKSYTKKTWINAKTVSRKEAKAVLKSLKRFLNPESPAEKEEEEQERR